MKILCVPDVHGREFWIEPCQQWQGFIIFLGDYHDPYFFPETPESSLENLKRLVKFVTKNRDRCICLEGNHDEHYLAYAKDGCRFDAHHADTIRDLLSKLDLQLCYKKDNVLFSHAGITPDWCEHTGYELNDIIKGEMPLVNTYLEEVSWYRGGSEKYGSMLWCDVGEYYDLPHYPDYFQVFGHSQQVKDPIIKDDFACLDCRKCFIVDTETNEIKEYE